uniref:Exosome component 4 n=1 Tax=Coturnix japonica TaxID=93934 RepID=A0A8C2SQE1_COTJA
MAALELLSDEGYRADGRRAAELRKVRARMGVFAQADGSAYIEQGNTKALAVVYGPHEPRGPRSKALSDRAVLNCQYSMATFSTAERKRRPHGDRKSMEMALHLKQTFEAAIITELYPRSQIDIYVQIPSGGWQQLLRLRERRHVGSDGRRHRAARLRLRRLGGFGRGRGVGRPELHRGGGRGPAGGAGVTAGLWSHGLGADGRAAAP